MPTLVHGHLVSRHNLGTSVLEKTDARKTRVLSMRLAVQALPRAGLISFVFNALGNYKQQNIVRHLLGTSWKWLDARQMLGRLLNGR